VSRQAGQRTVLANGVSCKLGTMPAFVQVHGRDKIEPGRWIRVKEAVGGRWSSVLVNRVEPDGYFQADR